MFEDLNIVCYKICVTFADSVDSSLRSCACCILPTLDPHIFVQTKETKHSFESVCVCCFFCVFFSTRLQAHSYRTFQGITCLMQISTRSEDFIVDTLKLRSELVMLNEVFTDPKIVKVCACQSVIYCVLWWAWWFHIFCTISFEMIDSALATLNLLFRILSGFSEIVTKQSDLLCWLCACAGACGILFVLSLAWSAWTLSCYAS